MTFDRTTLSESVDRDTVRTASKLSIGALSLVAVLFLVTLLPGVDRLVPRTPVTFAAVVGAIAALAVAGLLLSVASRVASLARMTVDAPRTVVETIASIAYWLVVLAAVLVAHAGLAGIAAPLLGDAVWLYDVAFLLLALPIVVVVAARLYAGLDPGAEYVAERVAGDEPTTRDDATPGEGR